MSVSLKNFFWKINIAMTPVLIEASAKSNTGRKNSNSSPAQKGT
jgi:hypothetical protein